MKVLFITKPFVIEPLGLMYVSAAAKRAGHKVELITTEEDLKRKVLEYKPEVIGFSVMTGDQKFYLEISYELKKSHNFMSIFGGPHPTFFPDVVKENGVDVICRGEGMEAFVEFLDSLQKGKDITEIKNLAFNINGKIKINEVRPFSDVDSSHFPDRDLVNIFPEIRDGPIKHFIASFGCPFGCSYCFNEQYSAIYSGKGKRVRFRNVKLLVDEVEEVINSTPTKFVYFQDDTFTLNLKWLEDFAKEYSKRIKLPFHCHVRPNTVNEKTIQALKKAGCYSTHIAAESGNDRIRNEVLNRNMSREQIVSASHLLKKAGIKFMLQNMIGLPTGTLRNDLETLELNIECKPDYAWVSIFQPYPGTPIGEFCRKEGFYIGDFSDLKSSFFESSCLNFSEEYKLQLANLQKLFAIFVEIPKLYKSNKYKEMINLPSTPQVKEAYQKAYTRIRNRGDERLYGFKL
ncbi:B12-binding domain-containing radical SAM protein [archaeon]|nr:B12-binding domain-containing radical SAM protein [archaeon]